MQVTIIGGGAAGLMAAIVAAGQGASVTVLEQNEVPGKKLLVTGNGKCNLTNVVQDPFCYHSSDPDFPWQVISAFPLSETLKFFTGIGIYTKNRNQGLYPYSEQAAAVRDVLVMEARQRKVKIKTREKVCSLRKSRDDKTGKEQFYIETKSYTYQADRVIVTCGGNTSSVSGSGEDGFLLAKSMGHHIVPVLPALAGLRGVGNYFAKWAGVRFEGAVTLLIDGKETISKRGEIQFTDYGISGIPVFQVSRFASRACYEGRRVTAVLDFMPDFSLEQLTVFLEQRMENCPYKTLKESMVGLLPQKLIPVLCTETKYLSELAGRMKAFPVGIKAVYSKKQAQVCTGGVSTAEIHPETMESRLVSGLYFAGEVVDVDGTCGGYNLQWAWSSAAVAGFSCTK